MVVGYGQRTATTTTDRKISGKSRDQPDRIRRRGSRVGRGAGSPIGLHRVVEPAGVLPQAAWRLDPSPDLYDDEVRVRVERLNLDAASFRQLSEAAAGDGLAVREQVCEIVRTRGKMHNPVTGSGGMLVGVVDEVGP